MGVLCIVHFGVSSGQTFCLIHHVTSIVVDIQTSLAPRSRICRCHISFSGLLVASAIMFLPASRITLRYTPGLHTQFLVDAWQSVFQPGHRARCPPYLGDIGAIILSRTSSLYELTFSFNEQSLPRIKPRIFRLDWHSIVKFPIRINNDTLR